MNNVKVENNDNVVMRVLKGIMISFIITLVCIFIFSIILTYTNMSDSNIPIFIIILTFVSILIGTMISVKKISKNGLVNGSIIGGSYVIFLYLISSIINTGFTINIYTILMIGAGIVSGIIGGIIGINTK